MKRKLALLVGCFLSVLISSTASGQPDLWKALAKKSLDLYKRGKNKEAEKVALESLRYAEKHLGRDSPFAATSHLNLGNIYEALRDYDRAEYHLKMALSVTLKSSGEMTSKGATIYGSLGDLYRKQGKYSEALGATQKALAITAKIRGTNNWDYGSLLTDLGKVHEALGDHSKAEGLYKKAFQTYVQSVGAKHPLTAMALNDLAIICRKQGKYREAELFHRGAIKIFAKAAGENHYRIGKFLRELAITYSKQKKFREALDAANLAGQILLKRLGKHPELAENFDFMGMLYSRTKEYEKAAKAFEFALKIYLDSYGPVHPKIERVLERMVGLYRAMGKIKEAQKCEKMLTQILDLKYKKKRKGR